MVYNQGPNAMVRTYRNPGFCEDLGKYMRNTAMFAGSNSAYSTIDDTIKKHVEKYNKATEFSNTPYRSQDSFTQDKNSPAKYTLADN